MALRLNTCIPNPETSVYIFLSKEQGTNPIKGPVKLRSLIFHLAAFAAVERTAITHSWSIWERGLNDSFILCSPLNDALASGVEIAEWCVCVYSLK